MTLPDKVADGLQQEFKWDDNTDSNSSATPEHRAENMIHTHFIQGTTLVFDSFSDEQDVQRRNLAATNISKINDTLRRFETDFTVRASGKVTAVLSASTVANYRVVDVKKGHRTHTPTPAPMPSFSSVISGAATMAQSDKELASSLAACASDTSDSHTDQLRKRCRTMLQQRYVHRAGEASISLVNQKANYALSVKKDGVPGVTAPFCPATATHANFFAPVLRPIAVQQALSQIKPEHRGMDHDGQPVDGGGGVVAVDAFAESRHSSAAFDGMGDKSHLGSPSASPSPANPAGTSAPLSSVPLPKLCPTASADVTTQSAFSIFIGGQRPIIFPTHPVPSDGHRISSSDLVLTTMACPVPVDGLMNFSDINFHRSSDEIITLAAAW